MKKLYVSATLYYGYEIDVPDEKLNDKFNLVNYAAEVDPLELRGVDTASCEWYLNSIFDEEGNEYYAG